MPSGLTYDVRVTATRKLVLTAAMFVVALGLVGLAAATHVVAPLFAAWAPLLAVPYLLTRPEPGETLGDEQPAATTDPGSQADEGGPASEDATEPAAEEATESGPSPEPS